MFGRKLKLDKEDSAIILKKGGGLELVIPKQKDENAPVSDEIYLLTGVAILIGENNKKFYKLIEQVMDKVCAMAEEIENKNKE